jgi:hypothetical protein
MTGTLFRSATFFLNRNLLQIRNCEIPCVPNSITANMPTSRVEESSLIIIIHQPPLITLVVQKDKYKSLINWVYPYSSIM